MENTKLTVEEVERLTKIQQDNRIRKSGNY